MIGFVKGTIDGFLPGRVLVEVNGIGINVLISDMTRESLPTAGNEIKLYTYMSVREDDISLYGFLTLEEQNIFNLLIGVSGVGPKGALNILGTYSVSDIKYFIVTEDSKSISKAPTIGKKTAEKIIIDLKDKINKDDILEYQISSQIVSSNGSLPESALDAIEALMALGYDRKAAENSVSQVEHPDELDANQILKLALKYMF